MRIQIQTYLTLVTIIKSVGVIQFLLNTCLVD